ncbi:MAG: NAD-dependent epimerase/dehydratase family protein [Verrucomicrobia bacterium]|nr:NAD-dependent epimerase/dehydratase family protein [Verrucomicrobiota bacterium]
MKILVTGAAGFIGYHVASSLLDDGHEVVGADNFNDYYRVRLKRDRHARLEGRPGYTGIEIDLADRAATEGLFRAHRFDVVCHLAAQAGVRYSIENPFAYERANVAAFLNVLEGCRHGAVPRLVYASSSSVYGGNTKLPFAEDDPVDHPVSLYAATKKANELMAHTYTHLYKFQTIGLRFFTVYGPWGRPDMAAWIFTERLGRGETIPVFNHGRMKRDFTYIDDIVQGVRAALFRSGLDPYEIVNLGHNHPEDLLEMIALIARCLGVEPRMELLPLQPGDVVSTYADISHAKAKLGFEPRTPLAEGMPRFVQWFREYHGK